MRRHIHTLGLGLLIGALGVLAHTLPFGSAWEEESGLSMLFTLRGAKPAPDGVMVVAISDDSGPQLGFDPAVPAWPRSAHAQLIDLLSTAGAEIIVFDIDFKKEQSRNEDERLAAAMRRAGNVILFGYLERDRVKMEAGTPLTETLGTLEIEHLRPPAALFADSAATVAPFILPKIPVKVSRVWTFHGANQLATLPAATLEVLATDTFPDLLRLLALLRPRQVDLPEDEFSRASTDSQINLIRTLLRTDRNLTTELLEALSSGHTFAIAAENRRRLGALLTMYLNTSYPFINFYGPPRTLATVSYEDVLSADAEQLANFKDKVVFVGYAEQYQPKQKDGFYTVFSQPSGLDLSGVEIGATVFANLLAGDLLRPLPPLGLVAVLLLYGILITFGFRSTPAYFNIGLGLLISLLYFILVYQLFTRSNIWLPLTIPLFVQTPVALFAALTQQFREARRSRQQIRDAFGYYLPEKVIDRLAHDSGQALAHGEHAFGVCLATDAEQYTRLAEGMNPGELKTFLNRYYEVLFAPVRARGGMISDVVGDAMLAIWSAPSAEARLRRDACEAALEIKQALDRSQQKPKLPTRIGLHAGELVLSHIGAIDHYEYRAIGDIVNTASRIENLNKQLGTSILASRETIDGLEGFITRELGSFRLKGKQQAVTLYEIVCKADALTSDVEKLHAAFAAALDAYRQQYWQDALELFKGVLRNHPDDGPSRFYLDLFRDRRNSAQSIFESTPDKRSEL
jgi:adenylate cyclase